MEKDYVTYILESEKTGKYYIGHTDDIEKRIKRHNSSLSGWTKKYRPWKVVYTEKHATRGEAMRAERYLKSLKNRDRIRQYIAGWRRGTSRGS